MATGDKLVNLDELKLVYDSTYTRSQIDNKIDQSDGVRNLKTYTSVTQLGLTARSATILSAYNALSNESALYAESGDFAAGETPYDGVVEIIRRQPARVYVAFHSKVAQNHEYRMYQAPTSYNNNDNNAPSGEWVLVLDENILPTKLLYQKNLDDIKYTYHGYASDCTATGFSGQIHGPFISSSNNISGSANRTAQLVFTLSGNVLYRLFGSNGWTSWQKFTTTVYTS